MKEYINGSLHCVKDNDTCLIISYTSYNRWFAILSFVVIFIYDNSIQITRISRETGLNGDGTIFLDKT